MAKELKIRWLFAGISALAFAGILLVPNKLVAGPNEPEKEEAKEDENSSENASGEDAEVSGEGEFTEEGGDEIEGEVEAEEDQDLKNLDKIKVWAYSDEGRRDPFTFFDKVDIAVDDGDDFDGEEEAAPQDKKRFYEIKKKVEKFYRLAEIAMLAKPKPNAQKAVNLTEKGLSVFEEESHEIQKFTNEEHEILRQIRDKLLRLNTAANRLLMRQKAETDFRDLSLSVSGILWKDRGSKAIINDEVKGKGSPIQTGSGADNLFVEDILKDQVIFRFRGFKMRLRMD